MGFENIDRLFDDALNRAELGNAPAPAVANDVMAADHFLLKKSWDYFRERVRTIEAHWDEILKAKEAEGISLKEEVLHLKERIAELERETDRLQMFEDSVRETRTDDFVSFDKMSQKLKLAWNEERIALEIKIKTLEDEIPFHKAESERLKKAHHEREQKLREFVDRLEQDKAVLAQKSLDERKDLETQVTGIKEEEESWMRKVDLLRKEVERRDQFVKEMELKLSDEKRLLEAARGDAKDARETIKEMDLKIRGLEMKISTLDKEKEILRQSWQREQAEWRELWDRAREMWDKNRPQK